MITYDEYLRIFQTDHDLSQEAISLLPPEETSRYNSSHEKYARLLKSFLPKLDPDLENLYMQLEEARNYTAGIVSNAMYLKGREDGADPSCGRS